MVKFRHFHSLPGTVGTVMWIREARAAEPIIAEARSIIQAFHLAVQTLTKVTPFFSNTISRFERSFWQCLFFWYHVDPAVALLRDVKP